MDKVVKVSPRMMLTIKCMELNLSESTTKRILAYTKGGGPEHREERCWTLLNMIKECESEREVIAAFNSMN
ncbi:MAG: hypothetical protein KBS66_07935 [Eubacterium sp.]|nr:hypothetical protein [Candidatus Colimonas fimequi]